MYESKSSSELPPSRVEANTLIGQSPLIQPESVGGASSEITCPATPEEVQEVTAQSQKTASSPKTTFDAAELSRIHQRQVYIISEPGDSATDHRVEVDSQTAQRVNEFLGDIQKDLVKRFPSDRRGMEIARVDNFIQGLGLAATSVTIEVPSHLRGEAVRALQQLKAVVDMNLDGVYLPELDTVVTFRDDQLEARNGVTVADKHRVHELTHSNGVPSVHLNGDTIEHIGTGYKEKTANGYENLFLEEGLAEMVAGKYIAEELNMPHGLLDLRDPIIATSKMIMGRQRNMYMPSRYISMNQKGQLMTTEGASAAASLELLIQRDPALLPALIAGHRENQEARREVEGRINAIAPGLYEHLKRTYDTPAVFPTGLFVVRAALGYSQ